MPQKCGTVIHMSWLTLLGFDGEIPVFVAKANFVTELQNSQPSSDKAKHRPPILGESSILFPFYGPDSPPCTVCPSNHSFLNIRPQILLQGTTMSIVNFHKATMLMDVSDEW